MSRDKQIEEMANIIALKAFEQAHLIDGDENLADIVAEDLYEKGYRKASDVAREIFEEIEENTNSYKVPFSNGEIRELIVMAIDKEDYNKIKKKYESEK